jgi:hypothetical protein
MESPKPRKPEEVKQSCLRSSKVENAKQARFDFDVQDSGRIMVRERQSVESETPPQQFENNPTAHTP